MVKVIKLLCGFLCILSVNAYRKANKRNKYYVPPSETPGFTSLDDYAGQDLDRKWDITGGQIHVDQEVNSDVQLTWRKDDTSVQLNKWANSDVHQQWQFGSGVKVVIKHAANSDVYQMWNIGNKWYHYEKSANGDVKSEGSASSQDIDRYKREIDLWCEANQRFFHPQYCRIY